MADWTPRYAMNSNTQILGLVLVGLFPLANGLSGQDVKTISHGQKVNINRSLASGKHTIVEFYADW